MHLIMKFHNKIKCAILLAYAFLPAYHFSNCHSYFYIIANSFFKYLVIIFICLKLISNKY